MLNHYGPQTSQRPSYSDPMKLLAFLNSRKLAMSSRYYRSGSPAGELGLFMGPDPTDVPRETRARSGEIMLLFAVFEQAYDDLRGPDAIQVQDAWDWFSGGIDHPFAFQRVCEQLGVDVERARNALWAEFGAHVLTARRLLDRGQRRMERVQRLVGGGS